MLKTAASVVLGSFPILFLIGLAGTEAAGAETEGYGPFSVRNFQPMQMLVLGMPGDRAAVIRKGALDIRVELAETSTVFREDIGQVSTSMKFETTRAGVFFRYGLTDRLELGLEVPAYHRYRGFLEGAIKAAERMSPRGLTTARNRLQGTGFDFRMTRNGQTLFRGGDNEFGIGDITASAKYQMLAQTADLPALSLRVALKVPSGDEGRFFGSGHTDVGIGLAAEKALAPKWIAYVNTNAIIPTGRVSDLPLSPFMTALAGLEYRWSPAFSIVGQFDYYGSPYHDTGTRILDRAVTEGLLGFNYRIRKNVLWQVYAVENLDFIEGAAADFTLSTAITYRFSS